MLRVTFLGDSITAGYGLAHRHSYPHIVGEKLNRAGIPVDVLNAGVSGDTTSDGLRRLKQVLKVPPHFLIIALGANDMIRGLDVATIRFNLEKMISQAIAEEINPVLFGMKSIPFYGSEYVQRYDRIFPELADLFQIPYLPFFIEEIALQAEFNQNDGLHPNQAGQEKLASRVTTFLEPILKNYLRLNPVFKNDQVG